MHNFTARPDKTDHPTQLQIVRCLPGKPITALVTSEDALGAYTHFWKGRTSPCTSPNCEACAANYAPRWYGYLGVVAIDTKNPALFEITAACVQTLNDYLAEFGSLRAAHLTLSRANRKANSRLCCTLRPSPYKGNVLPPAPNIAEHLCRIWEIRTEPANEKQTRYRNRLAGRNANGAPTPD